MNTDWDAFPDAMLRKGAQERLLPLVHDAEASRWTCFLALLALVLLLSALVYGCASHNKPGLIPWVCAGLGVLSLLVSLLVLLRRVKAGRA